MAVSALGVQRARQAAGNAARKAVLIAVAALGGAVALFCFSNAGLIALEQQMEPAAAWSVIGGVYGVAGVVLYVLATFGLRRRP